MLSMWQANKGVVVVVFTTNNPEASNQISLF